MKQNINNRSGLALPLVILVVLLVTLLSGVMLTALNNEFRTRAATEEIISTKYFSEAGIEHGITEITKIIEDQMAIARTGAQLLQTINVTFDTIPGYGTNQLIQHNGQTLGQYGYLIETKLSESSLVQNLTFTVLEVSTGVYRAIPNHTRFKITANGQRSGSKNYRIEAEVDIGINFTNTNIEQVRIAKWTEFH
ncbi:hypothetical protein BHU72_12530 [Desulfuribacillus stibiiarsenatis]|uniref:Type 4 fimbrial biogenesis protein PilX N-terminal domain-containing protein n=1 Tax=Desulfuribacillus stibiiarsenatis TaxID=1390249 RepID=A0A1E5L2G4_9FIRM|nr:hypothetical protein [Desulfuribacillus stibiiarsenatis]OEH84223.1 hypothetical protein BHU72_12530 [Desulfuribacillus stibiiarsenatis]